MTGSRLRISIEGAAHRYGGIEVLDGIGLVCGLGRVLVMVGPSDCGKITFLGVVGKLIQSNRSRVTLKGMWRVTASTS